MHAVDVKVLVVVYRNLILLNTRKADYLQETEFCNNVGISKFAYLIVVTNLIFLRIVIKVLLVVVKCLMIVVFFVELCVE